MCVKSRSMLPLVTLALVVLFIISVVLFLVFKVSFYGTDPGIIVMFIIGLNFLFGILWLADMVKDKNSTQKKVP